MVASSSLQGRMILVIQNPEETFTKWNKEKILGDVVWVIRNFQPDVIITRFLQLEKVAMAISKRYTGRRGEAAADPKRFPEQLKWVQPWHAKDSVEYLVLAVLIQRTLRVSCKRGRITVWEKATERSLHRAAVLKSQGFGSAANRGDSYEYFKTINGAAPQKELLDDINISWSRIGKNGTAIEKMIAGIAQDFDNTAPEKSVNALINLYKTLDKTSTDNYWIKKKKQEVLQLIMWCSGLYMDAWTNQPYAVQTGAVDINIVLNNRAGVRAKLNNVQLDGINIGTDTALEKNKNYVFSKKLQVPLSKEITQPYWLKERMGDNAYTVDDQHLIGVSDVQ